MWGVFEKRSAVHTAPCTKEGYVESPHVLSVACRCQPVVELAYTRPLVTHRCFGCSVSLENQD